MAHDTQVSDELAPWLFEVAAALESAQTRDDIAAALKRATEELGFEHYSLGTAIVTMENIEWRLIISSAPASFLRWYDENNLASKDPIVKQAYNSVEPFFSDELALTPLQSLAFTFASWFMKHATKVGIAFALSAQMHGHSGVVTVCNFSKGEKVYERDRRAALRMARWVVGHAHVSLFRVIVSSVLANMQGEAELTPKERMCIELLAKGHSFKDVGVRLGVSKSTVEWYLGRSMSKLGASQGKDEAIGRAIARHEINVALRARTWSESDTLVELLATPADKYPAVPAMETVLDRIAAAKTNMELAEAALAGARRLGADRMSFVLREPDDEDAVQVVLSNYTGALRGLANDHDQCAYNPMVGGSRPREMPFRWDAATRLSPDEQQHLNEALRVASLADGPIHGASCVNMSPDGCLSTFSVVRREPFDESAWSQTAYVLFQFARALHVKGQEFAKNQADAAVLSERDQACLALLVKGVSIKDAAKHMNISYSSVRRISDNIVRRLKAKNIQHAVSLAQQRNLLRGDVPFDRLADSDHFIRTG